MCVICRSKDQKLIEGTATFPVADGDCVIVVKNVPCLVCARCGEEFFADDVMKRLENIIEKARDVAGEVLITDYSKTAA